MSAGSPCPPPPKLLLALPFIFAVGYTAGAWMVGRRVVRSPGKEIPAFLAGWAILRGIALIPFLGGITWLIATAFGLGAVFVGARYGPPTTITERVPRPEAGRRGGVRPQRVADVIGSLSVFWQVKRQGRVLWASFCG